MMKRRIMLCAFIVVNFCSINLFAHENTIVHPLITERAAKLSTIENYLATYPDFNGLDTQLSGKSILNWLRDGSITEDDPMCRSVNHFHNPLLSWNMSGMSDAPWFINSWCDAWSPYFSNVTWATGFLTAPPNGQKENFSTNFSYAPNNWDHARRYYFWALVSDSREMRDQYFASTFQALGQVMHLLQDASVPAHVRNDFISHLTFTGFCDPLGCYYFIPSKWFNSPFEYYVLAHSYLIDAAGSSLPTFQNPRLTDFWDTDQYTGANSSKSLSQGLAEYTSANYFSDETIPNNHPSSEHAFPYPALNRADYRICEDYEPYGMKMRKYVSRETCPPITEARTTDHFAAVSLMNREHEINDNNIGTLKLVLDDNAHNTYVKELLPRSIGYSAALLGYFFRGRMEVAEIPVFDDRNEKLQALHVTVRNVTPTGETMKGDGQSGCLMLSWRYASSDGSGEVWGRYPYCVLLPKDLPYGKDGNGNAIDDDEHEATIVFDNLDQTQGAPIWKKDYPRVAFTLAYVGTLGNETMLPSGTPGQISISGAVIGKHFTPSLSIAFDEEWMTAPRGDHPVWYMSHDAAGGVADPRFCNNLSCSDPISCPDEAGRATDIVDPENGGSLIMTNTRYAKPSCDPSSGGYSSPHCNVALIGYHNLSGDVYNPFDGSTGRYVFPVEITKDSYLQISVDEMSVNPVPPASGYATAYQTVEFYFSHGYVLQYSVGDQFLYNPSPYVGSFYLDPGHINADNIYELFAMYDFPTPPPDLKLNNIRIVQQTFPDLPCNLGYTQTMKVDLIRIGEMKPLH